MDADPQEQKRKRGAPPGNTNAVKHGAYSRWFRQLELTGLDQSNEDDLQGEIAMLRVLMQRLFELISAESPDIETMSKALTVLGKSAFHLGSLMRAEKTLHGEEKNSGVAAKLSKALSGVVKEMER